jgi:hypothetical protein
MWGGDVCHTCLVRDVSISTVSCSRWSLLYMNIKSDFLKFCTGLGMYISLHICQCGVLLTTKLGYEKFTSGSCTE